MYDGWLYIRDVDECNTRFIRSIKLYLEKRHFLGL